MRTLLVSEIFPPQHGGSGRWFWEIYRRLTPADYVIAAGEFLQQEAFDRTHDLPVVRIPLTYPALGLLNWRGVRAYFRSLRQLLPLVRRERIGVIHCGRTVPEGVLALVIRLWMGIPYLCYIHGEEMNLMASSRELSWLARKVLARAKCVIANSCNTERIICEQWGVPPSHIRLLHPGVDTSRFVPAPVNPSIRRELGWGDRPVVLTVGRLQKRKGHDTMIRALPTIRKSIPDILYAIVGNGVERASLEELVAAEGVGSHVRFHGELDDERLVRCYQQCDLFVLANREVARDIEGFGMVLLEAQACARTVIAGASGGTAETMRIGETGFVISCDGPEELATLIPCLLNDRPRLERMGDEARRWVVERFDWIALTRQAEQIFAGEKREEVELPGPGKRTLSKSKETC